MPTYKNETDGIITLAPYMKFYPDEVIVVDYALPYESLGLTRLSATTPPMKDLILAHETITLLADTSESGEAVGTGDAEEDSFMLAHAPVRAGTYAVYVDAVEVTEETDYTIDLSTGSIIFTTPPALGSVITADYDYKDIHAIELDYSSAYKLTVKASAGSINISFLLNGKNISITSPETFETELKWIHAPVLFLDSVAGGTAVLTALCV